jgi:predicted nucleic acid-binding protein
MKVLDTYALVEIWKGNKEFAYLIKEDYEIPSITLAEFWEILYKESSEETANYWINRFKASCAEPNLEIYIEARKFKYINNKKNLSIIDCIGYIYAHSKKYLFVTGDKEFDDVEGVEFIK